MLKQRSALISNAPMPKAKAGAIIESWKDAVDLEPPHGGGREKWTQTCVQTAMILIALFPVIDLFELEM